jgi:predicted DNA-binding transcriptional regulator YafY
MAMNHAARLDLLQRVFYRNPQGYRSSELARLCDVDQRTINRDLLELQGEPFYLPLVQEEEWRWRLMEGHRYTLPPIRLSLQEAAALYLAAGLLDRASDEPNPFVGRALLALANALPPEIGQRVRNVASARLGDERSPFARVFEAITLGWAIRRRVRIRYQSSGSERVHEYILCPYQIECSPVGYAAYVIGHASFFDAVRTFKLERILEAELLSEAFEAPADFDERTLLTDAWGVMFGEETTEVVLRFSPQVARRVRETSWHKSQQIEECADGSCILHVQVAHTIEMKPWIRGWGPDCEVLAPQELRRDVAEEMRRAAERYNDDGI